MEVLCSCGLGSMVGGGMQTQSSITLIPIPPTLYENGVVLASGNGAEYVSNSSLINAIM